MTDDYTTNSPYLTYTFLFRKVGRMYFLSWEWPSGPRAILELPGSSQNDQSKSMNFVSNEFSYLELIGGTGGIRTHSREGTKTVPPRMKDLLTILSTGGIKPRALRFISEGRGFDHASFLGIDVTGRAVKNVLIGYLKIDVTALFHRGASIMSYCCYPVLLPS